MATYVLIHGAGSDSWHWHLVVPLLRDGGHDVVAPDLPCSDESAGLAEYADVVLDAIGQRTRLVVVGQSLGAFVAPIVCERREAELLVLLNGMVPLPGESDWGKATAYSADPEADFESGDAFYHDVPEGVRAEAARHEPQQAERPMTEPWPLERWPDVPTRFLLSRDDRCFPADWQRGVVRDRLGIEPDEMDGGHCPNLSRPEDLVERLEALRARHARRA